VVLQFINEPRDRLLALTGLNCWKYHSTQSGWFKCHPFAKCHPLKTLTADVDTRDKCCEKCSGLVNHE
jgi:hypothetical protein